MQPNQWIPGADLDFSKVLSILGAARPFDARHNGATCDSPQYSTNPWTQCGAPRALGAFQGPYEDGDDGVLRVTGDDVGVRVHRNTEGTARIPAIVVSGKGTGIVLE